MSAASIRDLSESLHEIRNVSVVPGSIDDEGCRCGVENGVAALDGSFVCLIISLEWLDELCLCSNSYDDFEVVKEKWGGLLEKSFFNLVVACESKVNLPPVEVNVLYAVFLLHLSPVAPTSEALDKMVWEIALWNSECKVFLGH